MQIGGIMKKIILVTLIALAAVATFSIGKSGTVQVNDAHACLGERC
jgi:hypothetical protein